MFLNNQQNLESEFNEMAAWLDRTVSILGVSSTFYNEKREKREEQEEETILSENKAKTNLFIQIWEIAACFLQMQID